MGTAPSGIDWFNLETNPAAKLVKSGRSRKIWSVKTAEGTRFAKVGSVSGPWERLKAYLVGSAIQREWRIMCELMKRGVPAVVPLGVGRSSETRTRHALVTEGVDQACTLDDVWRHRVLATELNARRAASSPLIDEVAHLLATSHNLGFVHRDTHPQNILIQEKQGGGYSAVFVDVHRGKLTRGQARTRDTLESLAELDHFFQRVATRTQRLRFLIAYAGKRQPPSKGDDHREIALLVSAIARQRKNHALRLARNRDRRLRGDGKYFAVLAFPPRWRGRVVLRLGRRHVFAERAVKDRTIVDWQMLLPDLLASTKSTESTETARSPQSCTMAIQHPEGLLTRLRWLVRGSPARQAFFRSHHARHRDNAVPLVLGYFDATAWGLPTCCAMIIPTEANPSSIQNPESDRDDPH